MSNNNVFEVVDAPALLPHDFSSDSALRSNIEKKKENSYYYAHSRKMELPPDAKVLKGPGLITGGFPELIASLDSPAPKSARTPAVSLTKYSWLDDDSKVRIYLFKEGIPEADIELVQDIVECAFEDERTVNVDVKGKVNVYRLRFENLKAEIDASKSTCRVSSSKITITLTKRIPGSWSSLQHQR